jgi:prepilin-type N-terminal cleavage/methylation domain-containing protein
MKERGFTLIELLGVVIVLGIIAAIITPVVIKMIDKGADDADKVQYSNIVAAAKNWSAEHMDDLPVLNNEYKDVTITELQSGDGVNPAYLPNNLVRPGSKEEFDASAFVRILMKDNQLTYEIYENGVKIYDDGNKK